MLAEVFQDKAVQYVSGDMPEAEREAFEVLIQTDAELAAMVGKLCDAAATVSLAGSLKVVAPAPGLKARILASLTALPTPIELEALVATDAGGRIKWVNDVFTGMCGYSLEELKGRKPGELLQGADTDSFVVQRIRDSVRAGQSCRETLLNYHKDGSVYRVDVRIAPILDEHGRALCFVARERKLEAV